MRVITIGLLLIFHVSSIKIKTKDASDDLDQAMAKILNGGSSSAQVQQPKIETEEDFLDAALNSKIDPSAFLNDLDEPTSST